MRRRRRPCKHVQESLPRRRASDENRAMRLLVVDDDRALRDVLRRALSLAGYESASRRRAQSALAEVSGGVPDAVVLDVGLPDIDGLEVCRLLRREGNRVPVLMLTARDAVSDRIDGLDAGADDYLVKPFDIDELKARLRALLRRAGAEGDIDGGLIFEDLKLDPARHGVVVGEHFVELTRTEYQLLELLMLNPRRVLPHSLIYDRVWGYDFGPTSNALRVYVGYLRRKLEDAGARPVIHTVRGVGYALREPRMSLRTRMGIAAGVAVALAVLAVTVSAYEGTRSELRGQIDTRFSRSPAGSCTRSRTVSGRPATAAEGPVAAVRGRWCRTRLFNTGDCDRRARRQRADHSGVRWRRRIRAGRDPKRFDLPGAGRDARDSPPTRARWRSRRAGPVSTSPTRPSSGTTSA